MKFRQSIFLILLSGNFLSGCSWFSGEEDVVTMLPLPKVYNQLEPNIIWRCSAGRGSGELYSNLHPIWQDNCIFVADRSGVVKAIDVDSGKEIWSKNLSMTTGFFSRNRPAQLSGGPAAAGSRVYVGSELAKVYALDAQSGSIVWESTVDGEALSTPVISDGLVLIHTSNGALQALNESDGTVKWTVSLDVPPLTLRGESSPALAFGVVIIGSDNGQVSAITIDQGQLIWQQRICRPSSSNEISRINDVQTTPVVVNNVVYALAYNSNLVALDLHSGQIIWSRGIGSANNLLVNYDRIYLVDQNDYVIAIDTRDGIILWRQSYLLHRNLTPPILYNSYIVIGDSEGYLHWIKPDDGCLVAQQKVDNTGLLASPVVAGDKLIIQAKNGNVYAIKC